MKKILFLLTTLIFISCTKDKENTTVVVGEEEEKKPITMNVVNEKYDTYKGITVISRDPSSYTYENNKIVGILTYLFKTTVKYIGDNQIETDNLFNFNSVEQESRIKTLYSLSDGKVQYFVTENRTKYNDPKKPLYIYHDSITFEYKNDYLTKITKYSKIPYYTQGKYEKRLEQEVFWQNGNIVKIKSDRDETIYTYDDKPYITYGDVGYGTPLSELTFSKSLLLYGKIGKWNKNNVLTMNKTTKELLGYDFKSIKYNRELDKHNRVSKVLMQIEYMSKYEKNEYGDTAECAAVLDYE